MTGVPIIAIVDARAREFLAWLRHGRAAGLVLDVHVDEPSGSDHGPYRDEGGEA